MDVYICAWRKKLLLFSCVLLLLLLMAMMGLSLLLVLGCNIYYLGRQASIGGGGGHGRCDYRALALVLCDELCFEFYFGGEAVRS